MNLHGNVILFLLSFLCILAVYSEILQEEGNDTKGKKTKIIHKSNLNMTFWNKKWSKCAKNQLFLSKNHHRLGELPLASIMVLKSHHLKWDLQISIHIIWSEIQVWIQYFAMKMFSWIVTWFSGCFLHKFIYLVHFPSPCKISDQTD